MKKSIPPAPLGWNKTIADLVDEMMRGERASVGSPETDWARDYERSQIPAGMRFPRKGDIYEALEDMTVRYLTSWRAPRTSGGEGVLRKGDRVIVGSAPFYPKPVGVYASAWITTPWRRELFRLLSATHRTTRGSVSHSRRWS